MAMFDGGVSPYESSYYMGEGEAFIPYLQRLAAERRGGILGGGMFGSMGEAEKKPADVNASDILGSLLLKQTSGTDTSGGEALPTGPAYDEAYDRNGNGVLEPDELEAMTLAGALERQTGRALSPSGVLSVAGPAGMLLGVGADLLQNAADNRVIADALRDAGFSESQIEAMSAEQALDMMAKGNIGTYSYGKPTGDQVGAIPAGGGDNLIEAGLNLFRPQQSNPFVAMPNLPQSYRDVINPNYNPATGLFAVPTVANMAGAFDTGSLGRAAAEQRKAAIAEQERLERIQRQNEIDKQVRAAQAARTAAANASAGRSYIDSYAPSSVRSSGDSYTVSNSNTGYSANFSASPSFGSGTFDTSGTFGD